MAETFLTLVILFLFCLLAEGARPKVYPAASPTLASDDICKSMVESQGYVCEEHKVTTNDGYILGLQRIPVAHSGKKPTKPPVFLQHGIMVDAITWLLNSPTESLAFILADNGHEVWMANTRGTISSRGHTYLSPNDKAYWDWSWDELVAQDLPATIQYVYDQKGQEMHYVGHSLGTLIALAAFSQSKLLNMLKSAALLSPIAYMGQVPSPLSKAAAYAFSAEYLYWLGISEYAPGGAVVTDLVKEICDQANIDCTNLMTPFLGKNCCLNSSKTGDYLDHEPQSSATKNMIHLSQMIRKGTITMYDYGSEYENNEHYGQASPPVYDMSSIPNDFPLFLSYGGQDLLSDVEDVQELLDTLKDHDPDKLVVHYRENYGHMDFILGVDAKQVVYDHMMAFFHLH